MLTLAARKKSRWDKRRGRPRAEKIEPTPETLAKCRPDVLGMLHKAGVIDGAERQAGEDIRVCWELMTRGLFVSSVDHARRFFRDESAKTPLERMTADELRTYRERYVPWSREMGKVTVTDGVSRLQMVLDIVADNYAPVEVAAWYRLTGIEVSNHLRSALRRFAEIDG